MKTTGSFFKGVATGAVLGIGVTMFMNPMDKREVKKLQQDTGKFFSTVGGVLDSVFNQ